MSPSESSAAEATPTRGVIVLKTGGVLRGEIVPAGNRFHVRTEKSQVDVAAHQVAFVCESLEAAYERQRSEIAQPTAEAHLALAQWCLRYELVDQATRELADARGLEARHPRLALLERRVAVLRQPRAVAPDAAASGADDSQADRLRTLDALAADLPDGAVERFTRKVQPLLVNNCTTAGCHQPGGEQEFQLDRAVLHGLSNRRTTLGNLEATLTLVDRAAPERSRLLAIPHEVHGGRKPPLLGKNQDRYLALLAEWIELATGAPLPQVEVAAAENVDAAAPKTPQSASAAHRSAMPTVAAQLIAEREAAEVFAGMPPVRYGVEAASWQPKDEFDPEIFNRSFAAPAKVPPRD